MTGYGILPPCFRAYFTGLLTVESENTSPYFQMDPVNEALCSFKELILLFFRVA